MPVGRWSGRALAAKAISATLTLRRPVDHSASIGCRVNIGLYEMRADAPDLFGQRAGALPTAPPANTMEREAKVPNP